MHSLPGVLDRDEVTFLICIVMLAYQLLEAFPLVAGKNLVLRPAAGIIAFLILFSIILVYSHTITSRSIFFKLILCISSNSLINFKVCL